MTLFNIIPIYFIALMLFAFTNPTSAECLPKEEEFMSCTFSNGKRVEVCVNDEVVQYSFGRPGQKPELTLTREFGFGAEMVPWNGIGRNIWEAIRFTNEGVTYEVYGGFDRLTAVDDTVISHFGGIFITDAQDVELAHLECRPETVSYGF